MAPKAQMIDVKAFVSEGQERPVDLSEFRDFWQSCTEEEKEQFKNELTQLREKGLA